MTFLRVPVSVEITLTKTFYVDEGPDDPSGGVAVTVKRLDGTEVQSGAATDATGVGVWTFALQERADLDLLKVEWLATGLAGANVTVVDWVEIVGAHFFAIGEVRAIHPDLTTSRFSTADLVARRIECEIECEDIRGFAQVPRFARAVVSGTGTSELVVPHFYPRVLRSVAYDGAAVGLGSVALRHSGVLIRTDGEVWPAGHQNVIVEYEHGLDFPPETVRRAALRRMRWWATQDKSGIPERAVSWQTAEGGGVFRLATPGVDWTGDPWVDAIYQRDRLKRVWIA